MANLLVVDDEQSICWGFVKLGESMGHAVETAASAEAGLRLAQESPPDLLILDVRLPGIDGLTALAQFRSYLGDAPVIVITAFGGLDTAVKAVQSGAFEYIIKPFELDEVRTAIQRALRAAPATSPASLEQADGEMIGRTPVMQSLFKQIALVAASDANVLISGESGVGKELAARAVHRYSARSDAPFVPVNIAALSESVAESELFGHVDGAFTGANRRRDGLLVRADGGALFLDEVADVPPPLQVKLLRAIEEGAVTPVGADAPVKTDFRVIAATHRDLPTRVRAEQFRHDLFFRLAAFEIEVPALRERVDDVALLASHFAAQIADGALSFSDAAVAELQSRRWLGNVRELKNAVQHAAVKARSGEVAPEHLPPPQMFLGESPAEKPAPLALAEASHSRAAELLNDPNVAGSVYAAFLQEVEGPLLTRAMQQYGNECAPAARALGLHRTTLKKKLLEHDLSV